MVTFNRQIIVGTARSVVALAVQIIEEGAEASQTICLIANNSISAGCIEEIFTAKYFLNSLI